MSKYSPEFLTEMKREPMSLNFIKQAINDKAILEAKVIKCDDDYTLTVSLGHHIIGKITFDELEYTEKGGLPKPVSAMSKVNKHIKFMPIEITNTDGETIVRCSRKMAQKECMDEYISKLIPGDIIDARALRVTSYGIFCDIGCGIVALLPTNNISVTHIINPEDILKGITRMKVVVKDNSNLFKIQLSHKELLGTWEEEVSKFNEGDIIPGVVLSTEDYGVFIRLSQNLSGLAEPTELTLNQNDVVSVQILSIKPESMKIRLNITERTEFETEEEKVEARKMKFSYNKTQGHISDWIYSTDGARKIIESHF